MGFLKSFYPQKSLFKKPFLILCIKALFQTNFYVVSKFAKQFAEHLQYFSDIGKFLKQI